MESAFGCGMLISASSFISLGISFISAAIVCFKKDKQFKDSCKNKNQPCEKADFLCVYFFSVFCKTVYKFNEFIVFNRKNGWVGKRAVGKHCKIAAFYNNVIVSTEIHRAENNV